RNRIDRFSRDVVRRLSCASPPLTGPLVDPARDRGVCSGVVRLASVEWRRLEGDRPPAQHQGRPANRGAEVRFWRWDPTKGTSGIALVLLGDADRSAQLRG